MANPALINVGFPVICAKCGVKGQVKPRTDYGGWYKSKMFRRLPRKKWYCPKHYQDGRAMDNKFYENFKTPDPEPVPQNVEAELYKLLDD